MFIQMNGFAQLIEAESRPYQFRIDMMMEIEDVSMSGEFHVLPYKIQISNILEAKMAEWYNLNGFSSTDADAIDGLIVKKIDEFLPDAIQLVGSEALEKSEIRCFFIEESLQFEIQINDFKPFKIAIPLSEVESFQNNFNTIEYSSQKIAYNDENEFVVTYIHIYNPSNMKKYVFYNTEDESVRAPSFSISLPKADL